MYGLHLLFVGGGVHHLLLAAVEKLAASRAGQSQQGVGSVSAEVVELFTAQAI